MDGLGGMRTQPMLLVEMVEISLLRGEGRGRRSVEIGRTGRQGTAIKKAVPHPRRDTTGRMLSAMVSQRMVTDIRYLGLAGPEWAKLTALQLRSSPSSAVTRAWPVERQKVILKGLIGRALQGLSIGSIGRLGGTIVQGEIHRRKPADRRA